MDRIMLPVNQQVQMNPNNTTRSADIFIRRLLFACIAPPTATWRRV